MKIAYSKGGLSKLRATIRARGAGGMGVLEEMFEALGERSVERMRHTMATTPSALVPGKGNRIDTAHMYKTTMFKVERGKNKVTLRFGWLDTQEDYFLYQDENADMPGRPSIPPMHAARGAFIVAEQEARRDIMEMIKWRKGA